MSFDELAGLGVVLLSAILMAVFAVMHRRTPLTFRNIPAFAKLRRAIGLAVEDGTRLHFSLGRGSLITPFGAAALAGLSMLRRVAELTSVSDRPPVATTGDSLLAVLAQDTLRAAYEASVVDGEFDPTTGRLAGVTPFSYAGGVIPVMRDENVSANVLIGNFGIEAALLTDASERSNAFTLAGSDNLPAQAVLFASTPDPLIGEEVYAAGAYVQAGPMHAASLRVQDILRWLIILAILIGAALKFMGIL